MGQNRCLVPSRSRTHHSVLFIEVLKEVWRAMYTHLLGTIIFSSFIGILLFLWPSFSWTNDILLSAVSSWKGGVHWWILRVHRASFFPQTSCSHSEIKSTKIPTRFNWCSKAMLHSLWALGNWRVLFFCGVSKPGCFCLLLPEIYEYPVRFIAHGVSSTPACTWLLMEMSQQPVLL